MTARAEATHESSQVKCEAQAKALSPSKRYRYDPPNNRDGCFKPQQHYQKPDCVTATLLYNKLGQLADTSLTSTRLVPCRLLLPTLLLVNWLSSTAQQQQQQATRLQHAYSRTGAAQALQKAVVTSGTPSQTFLPLLALKNARRASSTDLPMPSKEEGLLSCVDPLLSMLSLCGVLQQQQVEGAAAAAG
jgi:hypothetical protein